MFQSIRTRTTVVLTWVQLLIQTLDDPQRLMSLDIMEIKSILDTSNRTAQVVVSLAASLFGTGYYLNLKWR